MTYIGPSERGRINALAKQLETYIPGDIALSAWPLPLLEALVERVIALEQRLGEKREES